MTGQLLRWYYNERKHHYKFSWWRHLKNDLSGCSRSILAKQFLLKPLMMNSDRNLQIGPRLWIFGYPIILTRVVCLWRTFTILLKTEWYPAKCEKMSITNGLLKKFLKIMPFRFTACAVGMKLIAIKAKTVLIFEDCLMILQLCFWNVVAS